MEHILEPLRTLAVPIASLTMDPANARRHPERNLEAIRASLAKFGQRTPIVVQRQGMVVRAGNGRVAAAKALGWTHIAAVVVSESDVEATAFAVADNRSGSLGEWDNDTLAKLLGALPKEALAVTGFTDDELQALQKMDATLPDAGVSAAASKPVQDEAPEPPAEPTTRPGDVWVLGRHRVICSDSTDEQSVARVLAGCKPHVILTDPPYCSGGFQEAGRSAGSVGTTAKDLLDTRKVHNDTLSTRGYQALIRRVLQNVDAAVAYVFTDWRMWINLFDVMESCGFGVRNMIVWDKGTPGMGRGWRTQHELVMFGARTTVPFDNHKAQGNVIAAARTGNKHHATEKPIELLSKILAVTDMAETVYDPFLGSGSTLIAAEQLGRRCFGVEFDARYVDVVVQRWQNLTGQKAQREAAGA